MTQTLKQKRRLNFTRKQKGGGRLIDFLKTDINFINIGEKVQDFFSGLKNRFTKKQTFTEKVASGVTNVAAAPKQVITGVSDGVKNMVAPKPKGSFGGTRKRKQRKH